MAKNAIETMADEIVNAIDKSKNKYNYDKTYIGTVISVDGNNKYTINYNDANRSFKTKNDISLKIGDTVHITYPLGISKNAYMSEDISSSGGSSVSGVKTVDGQTGDIVLSDTYASKTNEHTHSNKTTLDEITSAKTSNWDSAYSHSTSAHAPSDAEKNIVVGIQKNGTDLSVGADRKVNITIPTTPSDIGALASDENAVSSTKSEKDLLGNVITTFYGHSLSVDGTTVSLKDANGGILSSVTISTSIVGSPTLIGDEPESPTVGMIWIEN